MKLKDEKKKRPVTSEHKKVNDNKNTFTHVHKHKHKVNINCVEIKNLPQPQTMNSVW